MTFDTTKIAGAMGTSSGKISRFRQAKAAGITEAATNELLNWTDEELRDLGEAG